MNEFTQHIPDFVDVLERPPAIFFETTEDLLGLEVVKRYGNERDFSHFAISGNVLMEISDEGFKHWVVGYIKKPDLVNLPVWGGWRFRAELPNGKKVTLGREVVSSCGDILTLEDGSKARNTRC